MCIRDRGLAWPSILAPVLSSQSNIGRRYSSFMIGSTIGWSLGSISMGFLYSLGGSFLVLIAAGLFYLSSYIIFVYFFPREYDTIIDTSTKLKEFKKLVRTLLPLLIAISLATFSIELAFNVMAVKLHSEISFVLKNYGVSDKGLEYILYGFLYGGLVTLLAIPVRIIAGILVDKYNPILIFMITTVAYIAYIWGLTLSRGLLTVIIWQIPLYPFYDISIYASASHYSPLTIKASSAGAVMAAQSIGGLAMTFMGFVVDICGLLLTATIMTICLVLSFTLSYYSLRKVLLQKTLSPRAFVRQ